MPSKPIGEMKCPVCGQIFQCTYVDYWVYKKQWFNHRYIMCSWTCYRKMEKKIDGKRTKAGRKARKDND